MKALNQARAGWVKADITPPLGLPMGGRGPRFAPGEEVHDPLEALVLLLEDSDGRRQLWVSLDLVGVATRTSFQMRQDIAMQTGIRLESIVVNCVHTHSGPMANADKYAAHIEKPAGLQDYEDSLIEKVVAAAVKAEGNLCGVTASIHRGISHIGINRRNRDAEGVMGMRPNADGVINSEIWILRLEAESKSAVIFSYGCHPVLVYGYAWNAISADWVGVCRRRLGDRIGEGTHCQFIQGLAGNVRPRIVADFERNAFRPAVAEEIEQVGRELAGDAAEALAKPGEVLELELAAASGHVLIPQDRKQAPTAAFWQEWVSSGDELGRNLGAFWTSRIEKGLSPSKAVCFEVGLLQLAVGHQIAWMGGEPVAEWLGVLRKGLGDDRLTIWGYCQDIPCYLPTDGLLSEAGYEVVMSRWYNKDGPAPFLSGIDQIVVDELVRLKTQLPS